MSARGMASSGGTGLAPVRGRCAAITAACVATLALALFVVAVAVRLPSDGVLAVLRDGVLYPLVCLATSVAAALRARGGSERLAWGALSVAFASSGSAEVYQAVALGNAPQVTPLVTSDVGYLGFFLSTYVGLWSLFRARSARAELGLALDSLTVAFTAGAACIAFVLQPILTRADGQLGTIVAVLALPAADAMLIAMVVSGAAVVGGRVDRELALVTCSLAGTLLGDFCFAYLTSHDGYLQGGVIDIAWLVGAVFMAWAAAVGTDWVTVSHTSQRSEWGSVALPLAATPVAIALLSPLADAELQPLARWLAVAALALSSVRLALAYREVAALKRRARRQAGTDELTGLHNRRGFAEEATQTLERLGGRAAPGVTRSPAAVPAALLMLDLDGFKEVNDSLGHAAGDALLVQLAGRLREGVRTPSDIVARFGGDEFCLLLPGAEAQEATEVAERMRAQLAEPVTVEGVRVQVTGSVGIAVFPSHAGDLGELTRLADTAMYEAKANRSGVVLHDDAAAHVGQHRLQRIAAIRDGLERGEFVLHYQPKVDLFTRGISGVEALVRWHHPAEGLIYPGDFLPLVEDAGLMSALTARVVELAVAQASAWRRAGRPLSVAVNLPPSVVLDAGLPERIREALSRHDLPADHLVAEITEETLLHDRKRARQVLDGLRATGVRIAIDDFGSGYSSLSYLRELPIDELKLDGSFITPMTQDTRAAAIVRSTVDLAHSLGLHMVAEGVEEQAAATQLAAYGCDSAQGYLYARPQPAEDLMRWLDEQPGSADELARPESSLERDGAAAPARGVGAELLPLAVSSPTDRGRQVWR